MRFGSIVRKAVTVAFLFGVTTTAAPALADDTPPDAWITAKTKLNILTNVEGQGDINVDTVDGIVTLHGMVASEEAKQQAETAAREIEGSKDVRNLLQIVSSKEQKAEVQAADDKIRTRVQDALRAEAELEKSSIEVQSVNDGVVLLAGEARSFGDHLRAVQVAREVEGVKQVSTEVTSPDEKANAEVWKRIESAEAEASGSAKAAKEKGESLAGQTKSIAGDVAGATKDAARVVAGATQDAYITSATKARLFARDETPGWDINVDTEDGVVKLFGTVPSEEAKQKAEKEASEVAGVERVENELEVKASAGIGEQEDSE